MDTFRLIQHIKSHLKFTFDEVDNWFNTDKITLEYIPASAGWSD